MSIEYEHVGPAPLDPAATEHMVAMRDGVRLATDVYLASSPATPGAVILIRLPYDKAGSYTAMPLVASHMNGRGYHVAVQDVRGKFRSEGETVMFVHEAADGSDTIDWVVEQDWCDGSVAMWGDSYYGFTQFAALSSGNPALKAIAPRLTGTRLGAVPSRPAGRRTGEVEMGVHRLYPCTYFQSNDAYFWEMDWARAPLVDAVEEWFETVGHRSPTYDAWLRDPESLQRFPLGDPFDAPPIPILMTIGYWDNCAPWQWDDHAELVARRRWAEHEYLVLEAIDHENYSFADVPIGPHNDHAVDATALAAVLAASIDPALDFFDVFVRGIGDASEVPRVRYEIAGTSERRTAERWPPPGTQRHRWYPSPGGSLDREPDVVATEVTWVHDPDDPVPSPVGNAFAFLAEHPDERSLVERADVLGFDSAPIPSALTLVGPVELAATIASSGPEMDLFARLVDVAPDGGAHLVARGQLTLYDARRAERVVVRLGDVGYRLRAGHRLRLTISASDSPEFVVAPGSGEHRWLADRRTTNVERIELGGADPAVLTFGTVDDRRHGARERTRPGGTARQSPLLIAGIEALIERPATARGSGSTPR